MLVSNSLILESHVCTCHYDGVVRLAGGEPVDGGFEIALVTAQVDQLD